MLHKTILEHHFFKCLIFFYKTLSHSPSFERTVEVWEFCSLIYGNIRSIYARCENWNKRTMKALHKHKRSLCCAALYAQSLSVWLLPINDLFLLLSGFCLLRSLHWVFQRELCWASLREAQNAVRLLCYAVTFSIWLCAAALVFVLNSTFTGYVSGQEEREPQIEWSCLFSIGTGT